MKKHPWIYSSLFIILIWQGAYSLSKLPIIPSPYETFYYLLMNLGLLLSHVGHSFIRILQAIIITLLLGGFIGVITARSKLADQLLSPLLYTLYPVPKIAFLPLLMLLLGLGNITKIVLVTLILFFQVTITLRDHVKKIPGEYFLSINALGASKLQVYRHVILPGMLPGLFSALRLSIGTSISVLFFAENFSTDFGIGYYIMDSWLRFDYEGMFAGILMISLLGRFLFMLIDLSEQKLCPWNEV